MSEFSIKKLKGESHVFRIHGLDGTSQDIERCFDFNLPISELKSFILSLTNNEPFLLDYFMSNEIPAFNLIEKIKKQNDE